MKKSILSLKDLAWAKEHNPGLIEEVKKEVYVKEALEKYLEWLADEEVTTVVTSELRRYKKRPLGIHPSAACKKGVCLYRLYLDCTGEIPPRRPYDAPAQRIWDIGTLLHDTYQAHFNNMFGEQFTDEVSLKDPELHIKSSADGLFDFSQVRAVLEMKTIKDGGNFGWEKVQKSPMEDNVRQSHFYMRLSDSPFGNVFYIAKNTGKLKEHVIVFDFDLWEEMQTQVVEPVIDAAYNEGPKVKATPGYGCRWCDYNYDCPAVRQERIHVKGANRPWASRK